jgi:hypothetical protein
MPTERDTKTGMGLPVSGQVNVVVPPLIEARLTGAVEARQSASGIVTITYSDQSQETANMSDYDITSVGSWFDLVGRIQDRARK